MKLPKGWGGLVPVTCADCGWTTLITPNPEEVQRELLRIVAEEHKAKCPKVHDYSE